MENRLRGGRNGWDGARDLPPPPFEGFDDGDDFGGSDTSDPDDDEIVYYDDGEGGGGGAAADDGGDGIPFRWTTLSSSARSQRWRSAGMTQTQGSEQSQPSQQSQPDGSAAPASAAAAAVLPRRERRLRRYRNMVEERRRMGGEGGGGDDDDENGGYSSAGGGGEGAAAAAAADGDGRSLRGERCHAVDEGNDGDDGDDDDDEEDAFASIWSYFDGGRVESGPGEGEEGGAVAAAAADGSELPRQLEVESGQVSASPRGTSDGGCAHRVSYRRGENRGVDGAVDGGDGAALPPPIGRDESKSEPEPVSRGVDDSDADGRCAIDGAEGELNLPGRDAAGSGVGDGGRGGERRPGTGQARRDDLDVAAPVPVPSPPDGDVGGGNDDPTGADACAVAANSTVERPSVAPWTAASRDGGGRAVSDSSGGGGDDGCGIDMDRLRDQSLKRMRRPNDNSYGRNYARRRGRDGGGGSSRRDATKDDLADITNGQEDVLRAARRGHRHSRRQIGMDGAGEGGIDGQPGVPRPLSTAAAAGTSRRKGTVGRAGPAVGVKSAKSIVGSRPKHWNTSDRSTIRSRSSIASHSRHPSGGSQSVTPRASALSEATKIRPNRSMIGRSSGTKRSRSTLLADDRPRGTNDAGRLPPPPVAAKAAAQSSSVVPASQSSPPNRGIGDRASESSQNPSANSNRWEQNANIRSMQFAPAFLGRSSSDGLRDEYETSAGAAASSLSAAMTPNQAHSSSSRAASAPYMTPVNLDSSVMGSPQAFTPGRRPPRNGSSRKRMPSGPLMAQLRSVRSSSEGDRVRLQSGTYPYREASKRRMDVNDPRNRAAAHVDVTLVGDPSPWKGGVKRVTVLGYVHCIALREEKAGTSESIGIGQLRGMHGTGQIASFAWICLDYDTVNDQRISRGTQLRIYDPVSIGSTQVASGEDRPIPAIVCTKVCEGYPNTLPPLSEVPPFDLGLCS